MAHIIVCTEKEVRIVALWRGSGMEQYIIVGMTGAEQHFRRFLTREPGLQSRKACCRCIADLVAIYSGR